MRASVGEDHVQRVPVAPSTPPHPLDVIRLLRGNRTQKQGGQVPDVDAHLQGRGGRDQVRGPAGLSLYESGLDQQPLIRLEYPGVFAGDDPVITVRHEGPAQGGTIWPLSRSEVPVAADPGTT